MEYKKIIKSQDDIVYFLNLLNIDENYYSIGEYKENCICIFDNPNGYLVCNKVNDLEDKKIVYSLFELIHEVLKRIELKEEKRLVK